MTVSNYDMAHECMKSAESDRTRDIPVIEAMAAQTYATLALVDELRAQRQGIRDTVAEEVSDALMDARGSGDDAHYIIAKSASSATRNYGTGMDWKGNLEGAQEHLEILAGDGYDSYDVYRVSVEVVQP